jgi:hypothetical protein
VGWTEEDYFVVRGLHAASFEGGVKEDVVEAVNVRVAETGECE